MTTPTVEAVARAEAAVHALTDSERNRLLAWLIARDPGAVLDAIAAMRDWDAAAQAVEVS